MNECLPNRRRHKVATIAPGHRDKPVHKIFIDGQAGTTGLRIHERLASRDDLDILEVDPALRKDPKARREAILAADLVLLCLPDDAAREAVALAGKADVRFLDASTAHRVHPGWTYGFPELQPCQRTEISTAARVSNPGCYPTGFLAAIKPLRVAGLIEPDSQITVSALSGYSGGGRQLIERYETRGETHPAELWYARPYSLQMAHKHLPEMKRYAGLNLEPLFLPSVGHFHQGMLVSIGLSQPHFARKVTLADVHHALRCYYADEPCILVHPVNDLDSPDQGFMDPQANNGTNRLDLFVFGHDRQMLLMARLDNLGKGAAGAAVQNLNLMLQIDELEGLTV